jgi:hypothetical protein
VNISYDDKAGTCTFNLTSGWNLISVPLVLANNSVDAFFPADVSGEIIDLWGWDSSSQNWTYYSPDKTSPFQYFNRITTMDAGKGYWVNMNSSVTFTIQGIVPSNAPNATVPLVSNWNLVGLTGSSTVTPNVMYPIAEDVWGWNSTTQSWTYYSSDPDSPYWDFTHMSTVVPGQGQWVNM